MIKVSVVVPIYNVEKYLRECVDSILNQTLKDIEIILVDDGSPDNCPAIVDEYAQQDERVVAVHQPNSGYSVAVNKGIELAQGEYIGIIESDDWIEPDMYEKLYANAKKYDTDVTKGMFTSYNSTKPVDTRDEVYRSPSGIDLSLAPDGAFTVQEWPKIIAFHASIWSSIYRADFVKKIKIPETAGASYQDFPFMIHVMCAAKRISVVRKPFVHWRNDPDQGNSTSANGKKLLLMAKNSQTGIDIIKKYGLLEPLKEAFFVHVFWTNMGFFLRIQEKYRKQYYRELHKIFADIEHDEAFTFKFFRPEDKIYYKIVMNPHYSFVRATLFAMRTKNKLTQGTRRVLSKKR